MMHPFSITYVILYIFLFDIICWLLVIPTPLSITSYSKLSTCFQKITIFRAVLVTSIAIYCSLWKFSPRELAAMEGVCKHLLLIFLRNTDADGHLLFLCRSNQWTCLSLYILLIIFSTFYIGVWCNGNPTIYGFFFDLPTCSIAMNGLFSCALTIYHLTGVGTSCRRRWNGRGCYVWTGPCWTWQPYWRNYSVRRRFCHNPGYLTLTFSCYCCILLTVFTLILEGLNVCLLVFSFIVFSHKRTSIPSFY